MARATPSGEAFSLILTREIAFSVPPRSLPQALLPKRAARDLCCRRKGATPMNTTGNTILITGGGSGIGRGLAEAFHKLGNQVIIAGRRREVLDAVTGANPGMKSAAFDMQNLGELPGFAAGIARQYPSLNVLINNAGIMKAENLQEEAGNFATAEAIASLSA